MNWKFWKWIRIIKMEYHCEYIDSSGLFPCWKHFDNWNQCFKHYKETGHNNFSMEFIVSSK